MSTNKPLRVAIVGGGVCGLTCAVALQKLGVDVHIYEAAAQFSEIGAGIGLGLNAINILRSLGVYDDICARAMETDVTDGDPPARTSDKRGWFRYHSGMGDHKLLSDFGAKEQTSQGVHRAALLAALVAHVDPARAHFSKRCTRLAPHPSGAGALVHFQDGTTAAADVVLGADGIRSVVRRHVAGTADAPADPHLRFSNTRCFRALVPVARAAAAGCTFDYTDGVCFVGENKHLILFTVRGGTVINVVAFVSEPDSSPAAYPAPPPLAVQPVARAAVLAAYAGWGPEVTRLLECMDAPTQWSISVVHPPLAPADWTRGPVAVLGDAAHAMLPHLGVGAGQGLEDAHTVARLLAHPQTTPANAAAMLRAYATVRQPRAYRVWEQSRRAGDIWDSRDGREGIPVAEVREMWHYIWYHPLDADFEAAEHALVEEGVFKRPLAAL